MSDFPALSGQRLIKALGSLGFVVANRIAIGRDRRAAIISLSIPTDGANLYVSDYNEGVIKKIVLATEAISTVASTGFVTPCGLITDGTCLFVADYTSSNVVRVEISSGSASLLSVSFPSPARLTGIATDGSSLYVADSGNSSVWKIK
jgi:hypothetical protein